MSQKESKVTAEELVDGHVWQVNKNAKHRNVKYAGAEPVGEAGKEWLSLIMQEVFTVVGTNKEAKILADTIKRCFLEAEVGLSAGVLDRRQVHISHEKRDEGEYVVLVTPKHLFEKVFPAVDVYPAKRPPGAPGGWEQQKPR